MQKNSDKIFALATKKSKSAIALFRLSGRASIKSITNITNKKTIKEKKPTVCYLLNKNKEIIYWNLGEKELSISMTMV